MGELLLCHESIATMPFYMEGLGIHLYSLEELSYYIANNIYLIEADFINEELCTWIEKSVGRAELGQTLRQMMREECTLVKMIDFILVSVGYCTNKEMNEAHKVLSEMENKSEFECNKIRADRLMERQKYIASIYEYKRLLESDAVTQENPCLIGNIWHNLGTAYARLFLFDEAASCYQKAYEKNGNFESAKECMFCYRCMKDEQKFYDMADKFHLTDMDIVELKNELTMVSRNEDMVAFEEWLENIAKQNVRGSGLTEEINKKILQWKEDYTRICRM